MGGPAAPQTRPRGQRSTPQQVARGVRMPERRGSSARKKSQHALPLREQAGRQRQRRRRRMRRHWEHAVPTAPQTLCLPSVTTVGEPIERAASTSICARAPHDDEEAVRTGMRCRPHGLRSGHAPAERELRLQLHFAPLTPRVRVVVPLLGVGLLRQGPVLCCGRCGPHRVRKGEVDKRG